MKYIIIGQQCTGKSQVMEMLRGWGLRCGRIFTNIPKPEDGTESQQGIYIPRDYEYYPTKDILEVFENKAYVFLQELTCEGVGPDLGFRYMEGLSQWEWENNDVFAMSPDQLLGINAQSLGRSEVCFIWLDGTKSSRAARHRLEHRSYSFSEREEIEQPFTSDLCRYIYGFNESGPKVIYFSDEEPERAAVIAYTVIKHPELLTLYTTHFS